MLDAASGILENLTAGVVQKDSWAGICSNSGHHQAGAVSTDHQDEIFDAGIQLLEQLIISITDNSCPS